ncbi:hypothetical protein HQQ81_12430 [Microbacteriaceae bacterium VKM Ac-2854]|nr:hypothetical protein [Microbacteriaceae bacterium VKM Ac-2854]
MKAQSVVGIVTAAAATLAFYLAMLAIVPPTVTGAIHALEGPTAVPAPQATYTPPPAGFDLPEGLTPLDTRGLSADYGLDSDLELPGAVFRISIFADQGWSFVDGDRSRVRGLQNGCNVDGYASSYDGPAEQSDAEASALVAQQLLDTIAPGSAAPVEGERMLSFDGSAANLALRTLRVDDVIVPSVAGPADVIVAVRAMPKSGSSVGYIIVCPSGAFEASPPILDQLQWMLGLAAYR